MKTQTSIHFLMSKFLISFTNVVSKGHFHNLCFRFKVKTGIKENSYFFFQTGICFESQISHKIQHKVSSKYQQLHSRDSLTLLHTYKNNFQNDFLSKYLTCDLRGDSFFWNTPLTYNNIKISDNPNPTLIVNSDK